MPPTPRLEPWAPVRVVVVFVVATAVLGGLAASGSATRTRRAELTIGPIKAVFDETFRETEYSVPVDETSKGATVFYEWTLTLQKVDPNKGIDPGCINFGVLGGIEPTFVWHHGNADDPKYPAGCDHSKQGQYGHQGLISLIVSNDQGHHCSATYKGTNSSDATSVQNGVASEPVCGTEFP